MVKFWVFLRVVKRSLEKLIFFKKERKWSIIEFVLEDIFFLYLYGKVVKWEKVLNKNLEFK